MDTLLKTSIGNTLICLPQLDKILFYLTQPYKRILHLQKKTVLIIWLMLYQRGINLSRNF